jgi:hypothetical protein
VSSIATELRAGCHGTSPAGAGGPGHHHVTRARRRRGNRRRPGPGRLKR